MHHNRLIVNCGITSRPNTQQLKWDTRPVCKPVTTAAALPRHCHALPATMNLATATTLRSAFNLCHNHLKIANSKLHIPSKRVNLNTYLVHAMNQVCLITCASHAPICSYTWQQSSQPHEEQDAANLQQSGLRLCIKHTDTQHRPATFTLDMQHNRYISA